MGLEVGQEIEYKTLDGGVGRGKLLEKTPFGLWRIKDVKHTNIVQCPEAFIRPIHGNESPAPQLLIKYPPLRVMLTDNKPSQTWQQLLRTESQAVASQPHLYLLGDYATIGLEAMQRIETPYIRVSTSTDVDGYYLVFVIAEGE